MIVIPAICLASISEVASPGAWLHEGRCAMLRVMNSAAVDNDSVRDFMLVVDRTLLRENLKLTFEQRARKHLRVLQMVEELRRAGKKLRQKSDGS
jgi:hypothetical protein